MSGYEKVVGTSAEYAQKLHEDVIKSYYRFRNTAVETEDSPSVNILFEYENLLCNIRKDLGHKDKSIKRGDILRLFITDINKYL
jgi:hypothetical protein